jgi:virginiamycin B lyase
MHFGGIELGRPWRRELALMQAKCIVREHRSRPCPSKPGPAIEQGWTGSPASGHTAAMPVRADAWPQRTLRVRALAVAMGALLAVVACGSPAVTPDGTPGAAPTDAGTAAPSGTVAASPSQPSLAVSPEPSTATAVPVALSVREFDVPPGSHPHDVAPATDGGIWYTGQRTGVLGHLDPATGAVREIPLGGGSSPHGVITGPDGAAWITDSGRNAIIRVDGATDAVQVYPLPSDRSGANLNTAVFDASGILWFTGQSGVYGSLDPSSGEVEIYDDPEGRGPYGITSTPAGDVWYASLAGSHIARVDPATGAVTIVEPPTAGQGARRVWSDTQGRIWVSEWDAGQVGVHDPATGAWREWPLPGDGPQAYAVYVDERDIVWLTDFGANAIVRFDPATEVFDAVELPSADAAVRQLLGRPGEVWGAESAVDKLVVVTGG